ncbi:hypothetical protein Tsedi_00588 [Tepidimonas sediminis]|uniref:Uncharacterized protein n=1 Tax=Tepidimonas sediminis TaxID=2588941 RepID=A0A554WTI5_9BURK|nr:hypothetical protein [Tepidimonas sediminis]TSE26879.1 hypothetical protein Tsedi_00588 [Tepidimonas sediminis]
MLDARRLAHDQAAGLAAWGLQPPLRVVALIEVGEAAAALARRLAAGCARLGLEAVGVEGPPSLWHDAPPADVWLWCAEAQVLARWWPGDGARPLVPLLAQPEAIVGAYRALKLLRQHALAPAVVALARQPGEEPALAAALSALRRTCAQHLSWQPVAWTLGYHDACHPCGDAAADDAVVTRVLEVAWLLEGEPMQRRPMATC